MTAETLGLLAGAVLSLAFSYAPGLNTRFAALPPETKRLIMAGLLLVVSGYAFLEACTGIALLGVVVTCDQVGAVGLVRVYILALVANQGTYAATPLPALVRRIALGARKA